MFWKKKDNKIAGVTPAKLNLFLEVHGKRDDGFHELETIITTVDRFDRMSIEKVDSGQIELSCDWDPQLQQLRTGDDCFGDLPTDSNNLVYRAAELFLRDQKVECGLKIDLQKSIPSQAGLGGASGNAAGTLIALNELLETELAVEHLSALASELGSDIPFFVETQMAKNFSARCTGRGERVTPIDLPETLHFVVVKPPLGMPTQDIFSRLVLADDDDRRELDPDQLQESGFAWHRHLFNRLQRPAEKVSDQIRKLCEILNQSGCLGSQMTGSGSSCFGICQSAVAAQQIAAQVSAANVGFVFTCQKITDFSVPF